jgi:hypothetical protein
MTLARVPCTTPGRLFDMRSAHLEGIGGRVDAILNLRHALNALYSIQSNRMSIGQGDAEGGDMRPKPHMAVYK